MPPRNDPVVQNQPNTQQLIDAITVLTTAFTEFKTSQNLRHEAYLSAIDNLHQRISNSTPTPTPLSNQASGSTTHSDTDNTLKPPKSVFSLSMEVTPWTGSFRQNNFSHTTPSLALTVLLMSPDTWPVMLSVGTNGCTTTISSPLGMRSPVLWRSDLGPQPTITTNRLYSNSNKHPQLQIINATLSGSATG